MSNTLLIQLTNLNNWTSELDSTEVQRIRAAIDSRLKLVDKYLPSLKSIELTGDEDSPIAIAAYEIRFSDDPED